MVSDHDCQGWNTGMFVLGAIGRVPKSGCTLARLSENLIWQTRQTRLVSHAKSNLKRQAAGGIFLRHTLILESVGSFGKEKNVCATLCQQKPNVIGQQWAYVIQTLPTTHASIMWLMRETAPSPDCTSAHHASCRIEKRVGCGLRSTSARRAVRKCGRKSSNKVLGAAAFCSKQRHGSAGRQCASNKERSRHRCFGLHADPQQQAATVSVQCILGVT